MEKLQVEYVPKENLKAYRNNAKIHTAEQVEQIKESIREFGFNDPIAVWHDDEIIEGHGRLLAAMEMDEVEDVPIIRLDGLSDEQRKAYMLVHNQLTMNTGFDIDVLSDELDSIEIDLEKYGFGEIDIDFMDFEEAQAIDSSKRMGSTIVQCAIGAARFEIEDKTHQIYDATREIDEEKASVILTRILLGGEWK